MLDSIEAWNPRAFELSDNQKVEGFHEVKKAELRIRMEAALGRAPPLKGGSLLPPDMSVSMRSLPHVVAHVLLWVGTAPCCMLTCRARGSLGLPAVSTAVQMVK